MQQDSTAPVEVACPRCGKTQPITAFRQQNGGKRRTVCRSCESADQRARAAQYPDEYRRRKREGMQKQRATPEGKVKQLESSRRSYAKRGPEKERAMRHFRRENHFFWYRASLWNKRHRTQLSAFDLASIWKAQRGRCALSGRKLGRDAHLDHIIHVSKGGVHTLENLRWLDPTVNIARRDLTDKELFSLCSEILTWAKR